MSDNNRPPIDEAFRLGLAFLQKAYAYARDADTDLWDFALEIDRLHETGLTDEHLRWLVANGHLQCGQESSVYGDPHRSFHPSDNLDFTNRTCFVLTSSGSDFAVHALDQSWSKFGGRDTESPPSETP